MGVCKEMISLEVFAFGLLLTSTLTGLVTEAVKIILTEHNKTYRANTLAGVVATALSAAMGVGYILVMGMGFSTQIVVCIAALIFLSWLCAMVGYDKVIQAISQFKTSRKDETNGSNS
jgi:hypothetical protein